MRTVTKHNLPIPSTHNTHEFNLVLDANAKILCLRAEQRGYVEVPVLFIDELIPLEKPRARYYKWFRTGVTIGEGEYSYIGTFINSRGEWHLYGVSLATVVAAGKQ